MRKAEQRGKMEGLSHALQRGSAEQRAQRRVGTRGVALWYLQGLACVLTHVSSLALNVAGESCCHNTSCI